MNEDERLLREAQRSREETEKDREADVESGDVPSEPAEDSVGEPELPHEKRA